MKSQTLITLASFTGALSFVVPGHPVQAPLSNLPDSNAPDASDRSSSWLQEIESLISSAKDSDAAAKVQDAVHHLTDGVKEVVHDLEKVEEWIRDHADSLSDDFLDAFHDDDVLGSGGHDIDLSDYTIYQLIKKSTYTTKFAELADNHPHIREILNSTDSNFTLFVPVDSAFEHIPEGHDKPPKEWIEDTLLYHIGEGDWSTKKIYKSHTIPTTLHEELLGGDSQRLRVRTGFTGVYVNFGNKVVKADVVAKNGRIHAVRSVMPRPFAVGRSLSFFPDTFSTLLLAYERTDFVKFVHGVKMIGSTVFAPTNRAFAGLGPKVNAFLFNTEKGHKYLRAILKYHIVPDVTLYSDAVYDHEHDRESVGFSREHFDLKTLLGDAHLGADIAQWAGFYVIKVNGYTNVIVQDGVAKNGVVHAVDQVLLPPCKHGNGDGDAFGEMEVEDLIARLDDYLD